MSIAVGHAVTLCSRGAGRHGTVVRSSAVPAVRSRNGSPSDVMALAAADDGRTADRPGRPDQRGIGMLTRLGRFTVRRRRLVLSFTVLFMVVSVVLGTRAFGVLEGGGFEDPSSESERASEILGRDFDSGEADLVLVATAAGGDVDAPAARAAGAELAERVAASKGSRGERRTGASVRRPRCAARKAMPPSCSCASTTTSPTPPRSSADVRDTVDGDEGQSDGRRRWRRRRGCRRDRRPSRVTSPEPR